MNILEAKNITKQYAAHTALSDVSISIPRKSIFGLLGPNGAGKTSLIRIITQITGADSGEVYFEGERLMPKHIAYMGYLPEERGLYKKMKVGEQMLYLAQLKGMSQNEAKQKLKQWLERLEMLAWWNKNVEDLSKGMQQKVQFVATVLHQPKLIILDEPFSGFDPVNANLIKDEILRLRDEGSTIIFSTHRMDSVEELCDYMALINKSKKVLDGKKTDIKNSYKSNTFVVETDEPIGGLSAYFSVLRSERTPENTQRTHIKMLGGTTNDLLRELLDRVHIHAFHEHLPSINDIFIAKVGETR